MFGLWSDSIHDSHRKCVLLFAGSRTLYKVMTVATGFLFLLCMLYVPLYLCLGLIDILRSTSHCREVHMLQ